MTISDIKNEFFSWKFSRYKLMNFSIGFSALLLYEFFARPIYRPYIYAHQIDDFHVADTIGNTLGTIAAIFISIAIFSSNVSNGKYLLKIIVFSLIIYEISHPLLGKQMDVWDIFATLITGIISNLLIIRLFKNKKPAINNSQSSIRNA